MERRNFLRNSVLLGATGVLPVGAALSAPTGEKPVLTIAHITDVHITAGGDVPERADKCLKEVLKHKIDFILNGGDSIGDASYDNVQRNQVTEQWAVWDKFVGKTDLNVYSCIGNHDIWWKAPDEQDEMYGKPYVVKRLKIPNRYYSFSKKKWHFIILDGNSSGIKLDPEQMSWLEKELEGLRANTPVLIMSHYPILTVTNTWEGGQHGDHKELKKLFYKHRDKVRVCLSGHQHLLDEAVYNGVKYHCNGSMSGFWWGKGDEKSAQPYFYQESSPGYALLKLYEDGKVENQYIHLTS
ncbi:metallophosphoesterase family protein [Pedobacter nyackensis]|uniref:Calcineurin-like phosphoesterase n=1 Tax=Pedobacter nyackensis TaxID=475255 RepID=A0A1W2F5U9_9SPHI|nr:metallophosphoesterase [Pedobacter nyackensis]SMD17192.1 Calcineurin-like phosphoesterase [Pedobacter nyackensis]